MTSMVYEFPELQGIMGHHYAKAANKPSAVALAIEEHYLPKFADDVLPETLPGICVALADRLDSLTGLFAINKTPTGDKDPFALRRQALGVLRILIEKELPVSLTELIDVAYQHLQDKIDNPDTQTALYDFFLDRLKAMYLAKGIPAKAFEAVAVNRPDSPFDFHQRLLAVVAFQKLPESESLAQANKRVHNILSKNNSQQQSDEIDASLLKEPAEKTLFESLNSQQQKTKPLLEKHQYSAALKSFAELKNPTDAFFDTVMVMSEDKALQANRLSLLQHLRSLFLKVADISLL